MRDRTGRTSSCRWLPAVLSAAALAAGGCGPSGPELVRVGGRVTWEGQPVGIGEVYFVPTGSSQPAVGPLAADGTFELRSHAGRSGIEPGEYRVAVRSYEGSFIEGNVRYLVPEKFFHSETSNLTATIPADTSGRLELNFDLP